MAGREGASAETGAPSWHPVASLARSLGAGVVLVDAGGRVRALVHPAREGSGVDELSLPVSLWGLWRRLFSDTAERRKALEGLRAALGGAAGSFHGRVRCSAGRFLDLVMGPWQEGGDFAVLWLLPAPAGGQERYRELFDASPDFYVTFDRDGRIEEVNRRTTRETGFTVGELRGRRPYGFLSQASRKYLRDAIPSLLSTGSLENLELEIVRRDGRVLFMIVNAAVVSDHFGRMLGVRAVLRDVTRRTMLQRQLRQTDRLAATGRLAAGIAHEVNNPLQAVLTHMAVVEAALPGDFRGHDSWVSIQEGLARIRQIVEDMLDLHRGRGLERGAVDVHRVIDEALGLVRSHLRQRRIEVSVVRGTGVPPVAATMRHVYQIALNLMLNAIDAMAGGGTLTLHTRFAASLREVEIDVEDTGPGIPEDVLPRIFDPFLSSASETGTGLGLFVTYGLVREYGGRIRVNSTPGRGTRFTVFLPVWSPDVRRATEGNGVHTVPPC